LELGTGDLILSYLGTLWVSFGLWHIVFRDHARRTYLGWAQRAKKPKTKAYLTRVAGRLVWEGVVWAVGGVAWFYVAFGG
jgi:hypothetical protein